MRPPDASRYAVGGAGRTSLRAGASCSLFRAPRRTARAQNVRTELDDCHQHWRGHDRARGVTERYQRAPQAQRQPLQHALATLDVGGGRRGVPHAHRKWSPPLTHATCEPCTLSLVCMQRCALQPHFTGSFDQNLAALPERLASHGAPRVMQDGRRRFGDMGTEENHREKAVLVASTRNIVRS